MELLLLQKFFVKAIIVVVAFSTGVGLYLLGFSGKKVDQNHKTYLRRYMSITSFKFLQIIYLIYIDSETIASLLLIFDLLCFVPLTLIFWDKYLYLSRNNTVTLTMMFIPPCMFICFVIEQIYYDSVYSHILQIRITTAALSLFFFFKAIRIFYIDYKRKLRAFWFYSSNEKDSPDKRFIKNFLSFVVLFICNFVCFCIDGHIGRIILNIIVSLQVLMTTIYWIWAFFILKTDKDGYILREQNNTVSDRIPDEYTGLIRQ